MTEQFDAPVESTDDAAERRDEVVARVRDHAGTIARELALLQGGDYGKRSFETDDGEWTVKYEAGELQFLLFEGRKAETYVVSTHQPPDPEDLADAMTDYENFVASFNRYVRSLEGVLDEVAAEFPDVASTESVVAERELVLGRVREVADRMAHQLARYEGGEYGTYGTRVAGNRWELKWEESGASYLRVGGEGGIYLLSQYQPPSAHDVRRLAEDVPAFVEAFNEYVEDLDASLDGVSL
ncbi:hypothetical protein M0R88_03980 [Halorussus gelatinilyticus]|uniref:Profilin fold domain-containing protein n=1 Tax=Halorussus gelatinilyticus TaxID=2937524 RepID=A0A8U0IKW5_9EURY|nr:hypothetical protein [Halorussus gelatinilyticus]UPW01271.1 hypothetical protein M0R88_03980 [Halorussus gelatinilyticus]